MILLSSLGKFLSFKYFIFSFFKGRTSTAYCKNLIYVTLVHFNISTYLKSTGIFVFLHNGCDVLRHAYFCSPPYAHVLLDEDSIHS